MYLCYACGMFRCCLHRVLVPLLPPMPPPYVRSLGLMWLICYVLLLRPVLLATPVVAASSVRRRLFLHAPFCCLLSLPALLSVATVCLAPVLRLPCCPSVRPASPCPPFSVRPAPPCLPCRRLPPVVRRCSPPLLLSNMPNGLANVSRGLVGSL